jgi:hypothetical protein
MGQTKWNHLKWKCTNGLHYATHSMDELQMQ